MHAGSLSTLTFQDKSFIVITGVFVACALYTLERWRTKSQYSDTNAHVTTWQMCSIKKTKHKKTFFILENTYPTRIVWKKRQTWRTTVNELRPLYRLWLCRWGIHDFSDFKPRHQYQAHASSDVGETRQRTTWWGDSPKVPYTQYPSSDSNPHAYASESGSWTMRPLCAPHA